MINQPQEGTLSTLNRFILLVSLCVLIAGCTPTSGDSVDSAGAPTLTPESASDTALPSSTPAIEAAASPTPEPVVPTDAPPTSTPSAPVVLGAGDIQRIGLADAREMADSGAAQIYEVRSLELYRALHAAGALPFPETEMAARYAELPSDTGLIFY